MPVKWGPEYCPHCGEPINTTIGGANGICPHCHERIDD